MSDASEAAATIHPALQRLADAFPERGAIRSELDDVASFWVGPSIEVWANVDETTHRVRIRAYLPIASADEVVSWVKSQPRPYSGLLQVEGLDSGESQPRLLFERPLAEHGWSEDPLFDEIDRYLTAWMGNRNVQQDPGREAFVVTDDPVNQAPASAWLLMGSEASYPTVEDLARHRDNGRVGLSDLDWTTAKQSLRGDLVLVYFTSPRKSVHFVARAASDAFFSREIEVLADHDVNDAQWWGLLTPLIEIEPIRYAELKDAHHGHLVLRGRSGHYLSPEVIRKLDIRALHAADQPELERVLQVPTGHPELPTAEEVDLEVWRDLPVGLLLREAHVSSYLVTPLLRELLRGTGLTWQEQYRTGVGVPDFVILRGQTPVHVIEVKQVIRKIQGHGWSASPDFRQVRRYADELNVASTLMDSHRVLLIPPHGSRPRSTVTRGTATQADLDLIREHWVSQNPAPGQRRWRWWNVFDDDGPARGVITTDQDGIMLDATPSVAYDLLAVHILAGHHVSAVTSRIKTVAYQEILEGEDDYEIRRDKST